MIECGGGVRMYLSCDLDSNREGKEEGCSLACSLVEIEIVHSNSSLACLRKMKMLSSYSPSFSLPRRS